MTRFDAKEAIERARLGRLTSQIVPGAVFIVNEDFVYWPESRSKPRGHDSHRVIIVQAPSLCSPQSKPNTVLVVPCSSTGPGGAAPWDYVLPEGERGFDKPRIVVYVSLIQPVLKSDLQSYKDRISEKALREIQSIAAANMGIIVRPLDLSPRGEAKGESGATNDR
jgi:PemK-like, MazF-like toxin of type II toxin-antitoxin system